MNTGSRLIGMRSESCLGCEFLYHVAEGKVERRDQEGVQIAASKPMPGMVCNLAADDLVLTTVLEPMLLVYELT
jgi:hypothetical protein